MKRYGRGAASLECAFPEIGYPHVSCPSLPRPYTEVHSGAAR